MGEKMNRISSLALGTIFAVCALGVACSSGGDEDDNDDNKAGSTGNGGSNSTSGAPGGGTTSTTAGTTSTTAGTTSATAGTTGTTAGSGSGGTTSTAASVCDTGTRALPLAEAYIDNFEEATRFDGWYGFADTEPASPAIARVAGGALATGFGAHYAATGIHTPTATTKKGFGAGAGFNLVNTAGGETCLDVTAFDGISFWAKGTSGTGNIVKFQMIVPATQPADEAPKGDCASKMAACAYVHPAKAITLEADWKQYAIPFSDMTSAAAKVTGKILGFNVITPDEAWDFSIDEVTFYKGDAPTTPVEPPMEGAGGAAP
jgi:hypothetical protein